MRQLIYTWTAAAPALLKSIYSVMTKSYLNTQKTLNWNLIVYTWYNLNENVTKRLLTLIYILNTCSKLCWFYIDLTEQWTEQFSPATVISKELQTRFLVCFCYVSYPTSVGLKDSEANNQIQTFTGRKQHHESAHTFQHIHLLVEGSIFIST